MKLNEISENLSPAEVVISNKIDEFQEATEEMSRLGDFMAEALKNNPAAAREIQGDLDYLQRKMQGLMPILHAIEDKVRKAVNNG